MNRLFFAIVFVALAVATMPTYVNASYVVLQEANSENRGDNYMACVGGGCANKDTNYGTDTSVYISWPSTTVTNYSALVKFNVNDTMLPGEISNITKATISLYKTSICGSSGLGNITVSGSQNQTWAETGMTWNMLWGHMVNTANNFTRIYYNDTFACSVNNVWVNFDVTPWVKWVYSQNHDNVTFYFNSSKQTISTPTFNTKESADTALRPMLNITYEINGLDLSVINAWNTSGVVDYNVFSYNGTYNITNTSTTSNIILDARYMPTGNVNITIYKTGYPNITYANIPVNGTAVTSLFAYTTAIGDFVHITNPQNTTYYTSNIPVEFKTPTNYGNTFTLKYRLDGTNTTVNTTSGIWSGTIIQAFAKHFIQFFARNDDNMFNNFHEFNASINFNMVFSEFNINIVDEMTGYWLNLTGKNATLFVQCPGYFNNTQITSASTLNFTLPCEGSAVTLTINDTSQWGPISQFRTIRPQGGLGNITLFMINTSTSRPVYYVIHIADYLNQWPGAMLNITKAVPSVGQQIMVSQYLDAGNNVNTWLIDGQSYTITMISTDGLSIKNTGDLLIAYLYPSQTIGVSSLMPVPTTSTLPAYNFVCDQSIHTVAIDYADPANATTSVSMVVKYINGSPLYSTSISFNGTYYSINWNGIPDNTSIFTTMTATNTRYGTIIDSRGCYFSTTGRAVELGLPDTFYVPIAIFLIILVALIFSVYSASVGGIVTLMFSAMLFMFGWLPVSYLPIIFIGAITMIMIRFRKGESR